MRVNAPKVRNVLAAAPAVALAVALSVGCSRESARDVRADSAVVTPAATVTPTAKTKYVGLRYETLPAGFTYQSGAVVPATPRGEYDLAQVTTPAGTMIWLDSLGARSAGGRRTKVVRAGLSVQIAADERLLIGSCEANRKLDPLVIAIAVNEKTTPTATRFTKIRQAWRANTATGQFDLIPIDGIVCEDPGGGN